MEVSVHQPAAQRAEIDIRGGRVTDGPYNFPDTENPLDHLGISDKGSNHYAIYEGQQVSVPALYHVEGEAGKAKHATVAAAARKLIETHKRCNGGMYMTRAMVIDSPAAQFTAATSANLPATYKSKPVVYQDKEILAPGAIWDKSGVKHEVPEARLDRAVETFRLAKSKGMDITLPENHDGTGKNYGLVADLKRNEKGVLTATMGIFKDLLEEAKGKGVSISLLPKAIGSDGTEYTDLVDHVAINSLVQATGLADFTPALAATRSTIRGFDAFTTIQPHEDDMKISEKALQLARLVSGKADLPETEAVDALAKAVEASEAKLLELTRAQSPTPVSPREYAFAASCCESQMQNAIRAGMTPKNAKRLVASIIGSEINFGGIQLSRATEAGDSVRLEKMAILADAFKAIAADGNAGFIVPVGTQVVALDRALPADSPEDTSQQEPKKGVPYSVFATAMRQTGAPSDRAAYTEYCKKNGVEVAA